MSTATMRAHRTERRAGHRLWLIPILALTLLVGACGTVPGAAVDVDGHTVAMSTVQDRVDEMMDFVYGDSPDLVDDPHIRGMAQREQATNAIRHQLVGELAAREGLVVTQAQVNAFIRSRGGPEATAMALDTPVSGLADVVYDLLVLDRLVKKLPEGGTPVNDIRVDVKTVMASDRSEAVALRTKYLADPASMDADVAASEQLYGGLPQGPMSMLTTATNALVGVYSAAPGEIVLIPADTDAYFVVRIESREEPATNLTGDMVIAIQDIYSRLLVTSLLLAPYEADADIAVNPRYGVWDPKTMMVVPTPGRE